MKKQLKMTLKNSKISLHNLGCKVNSYEAEAMLSLLREAGAEIVGWEDTKADIYIINTCSVTNMADRKSRQMLHKARTMNPDAVVVAAGCYVQERAEELKKEADADILIGNNEKGRIAEILEAWLRAREKEKGTAESSSAYVPVIREEKKYELMHAGITSFRARTFIKVQDGCSQFCSYCIIPMLRGSIRSRDLSDTVREVREIAAGGCREVVLTGIHLSSYGMDFDSRTYEYAMNREIPSEHLLRLIEAAAAVPGIERVRLGSLEPRIITEEFVKRLSGIPELCPHFHLSLQSGCDRTLRAMNRHYDTAAFRRSAALLRETFPDAAITTDVIVGFPGETEEDFEESFRFIREIGFYELHVFKYSRRQGTAADRMDGQLTDRIKSSRSDRLLALEKEMSDAFRRRFLDRTEKVILEQLITLDGKQYLTGFNPEYVKFLVPIDDPEAAKGKIGEISGVKGVKLCETYVLAMTPEML